MTTFAPLSPKMTRASAKMPPTKKAGQQIGAKANPSNLCEPLSAHGEDARHQALGSSIGGNVVRDDC